MKILLVASGWMEVKLLVDELEKMDEQSHLFKQYRWHDVAVDILITGIGTTFTTFHLTNVLKDNHYDKVINIGLARSLTRELKIGETVNVVSDEFADLGIEKQSEFLTLFESGFIDINEFPFENGFLKTSDSECCSKFPKVRGITSNKSVGRETTIAEIKSKFSAHIETAEGAAVFYVCRWMGVDCFQIRSISNYVEPRDSSKWNIPLALENLKNSVISVLQKISVPVN
ncbi:futalosine hydrolase [Maribellus sp. YY47]|uniref:futalosine hydrolase n=1 Tax=Maribellus sp. YY47 TaxID=2929486 RepID=UPI0020012415|nr:futalosine hydrolase [Maribellus sp. YY47]MCK3682947.1 futalosine hydrolase [Maribellus sp. YY47]